MKMNKRKIIFFISIPLLLISIGVVNAAFSYNRTIEGEARTGDLYNIESYITNYSYFADRQLNNDNILSLEKEIGSYSIATGNFNADTKYYQFDASASKFVVVDDSKYEIGSPINDEYYTRETDEDTLKSNRNTFINNLNSRTNNPQYIDGNKIICFATKRIGAEYESGEYIYPNLNQLKFNFSFSTSIDVYVRIHFEDAWISKKIYANKVDQSYIVKDQLNGMYEMIDSNKVNANNVKAYFTIKVKNETTYNENQIYYIKTGNDYKYISIDETSFNNGIASGTNYYSIISSQAKEYSSQINYYKFSADSPFNFKELDNEEWYFDASSTTAYLKTKINVNEKENEIISKSDSLSIDSNYFYKTGNKPYSELVKVIIKFDVEIVEANRVYKIWGLDPSELV